jgi:hypothetical protein
MTGVRRRRLGALLVAGITVKPAAVKPVALKPVAMTLAAVTLVAVTLAGCGSERLREERQEREERLNVYPGSYRADLVAAMRAYLSNPANIRDAWVAEPAITPLGQRKRYAACVRFTARNSDGGYAGSKDVLAVFANGRFDQFIEPPIPSEPANEGSAPALVKQLCDAADYKRFPELEAMKR